jgi:hypothetical protein
MRIGLNVKIVEYGSLSDAHRSCERGNPDGTVNFTLNHVDMVPLEQTAMQYAYESGKLDAVVTLPPVSVHPGKHDDTRLICSNVEFPGEIILLHDSESLSYV